MEVINIVDIINQLGVIPETRFLYRNSEIIFNSHDTNGVLVEPTNDGKISFIYEKKHYIADTFKESPVIRNLLCIE